MLSIWFKSVSPKALIFEVTFVYPEKFWRVVIVRRSSLSSLSLRIQLSRLSISYKVTILEQRLTDMMSAKW